MTPNVNASGCVGREAHPESRAAARARQAAAKRVVSGLIGDSLQFVEGFEGLARAELVGLQRVQLRAQSIGLVGRLGRVGVEEVGLARAGAQLLLELGEM